MGGLIPRLLRNGTDQPVQNSFNDDSDNLRCSAEPLSQSPQHTSAAKRLDLPLLRQRRRSDSPPISCLPLEHSIRTSDSLCQISTPSCPRLRDLVVELKSVDWHELGIQLGVPIDRLDKIDEDYKDCDRKLSEVLKYWLNNDINPSWNTICGALQKIGRFHRIVVGIRIKYCSLRELRANHRQHRHRNRPVNTSAVAVFPLSQEASIEQTLTNLHGEFRVLVDAIRQLFTSKLVTINTIKDVLLGELPIGEVKGQVGFILAQSNNVRFIKEKTDIHELFIFLSNINAWDCLHPQLLEYLVQELGDDEAKTNMQTYKSKLIQFREATKMSQMSGWFGNLPEDPTFQKVVVSLGDSWKDRTYQEFEELRISLLRRQVFDKSPVSLCGVLSGSLLLSLFIPMDTDMAAVEQILTRESVLEFLMENEIFAIYYEGFCLMRDNAIDDNTKEARKEDSSAYHFTTGSRVMHEDSNMDVFTEMPKADSGTHVGASVTDITPSTSATYSMPTVEKETSQELNTPISFMPHKKEHDVIEKDYLDEIATIEEQLIDLSKKLYEHENQLQKQRIQHHQLLREREHYRELEEQLRKLRKHHEFVEHHQKETEHLEEHLKNLEEQLQKETEHLEERRKLREHRRELEEQLRKLRKHHEFVEHHQKETEHLEEQLQKETEHLEERRKLREHHRELVEQRRKDTELLEKQRRKLRERHRELVEQRRKDTELLEKQRRKLREHHEFVEHGQKKTELLEEHRRFLREHVEELQKEHEELSEIVKTLEETRKTKI